MNCRPHSAVAAVLLPLLLATGCAGTAPASGTTPSVTVATPQAKAEIAALFDRWNRSLATGDPNAVLANYAPDAILLPTLSDRVRHNPDELRDYFVHFLQAKPQGTITESNIRVFGDIAIDAGTYVFDTRKGKVPARYTFVYRKIGDKWLIVEHHSSMMPETTMAKAKH